ncbi:oligosaccharide flippase family protein [Syntrophorhabdus aromaticivorans]|uniref:Polysaccharide biosynthesis protein n=1 Tax=Syntrophorhabdus aromaticivorans TaxID=328301 RepID=A0A351U0S0_9BACT|nr:oligosaccharide flippase family protein [Syntrophorhabdus aromaticivorans]NLW35946.1 polysaccharide biosynthesis protein [Syntrophorhabdus aromaticivorans]HBA53551.1 hypothetical protein [Syntrophorhabdus aromaticivorans]
MLRDEIKFLLVHSSIYGLGTVAAKLVSFLLLPLYTRYLTPADYGVLELLDVTMGTAALVISLGLVRAMSRFYYEKTDAHYRNTVISTSYALYAFSALLFGIILLPFSGLIAKLSLRSESYTYLVVLSMADILIAGFTDVSLVYLRLIKKSHIFTLITVTRVAILCTLNILFVAYFHLGVLGIVYSSLIVRILFSAILATSVLYRTGIKVSVLLAKNMLVFSLPLIPAGILNLIVNKSDRFFLLYNLSLSAAGIYGLANKLGNSAHLLITESFVTAFSPRRFEMGNANPEQAPLILSKVFSYYVLVMICIGLIISLFVPEILRIMVTEKFFGAGPLVPFLILNMVIFGFRYHFEFGILWAKKTKYYMYINLFNCCLNLALNYSLIPRFGVYGAIIANLASTTAYSFSLFFVSARFYRIHYEFGRLLKAFCLATAFYIFSLSIRTHSLHIDVLLKLLLIPAFIVSLPVLGVVSKQETSQLRLILTRLIPNRRRPIARSQ